LVQAKLRRQDVGTQMDCFKVYMYSNIYIWKNRRNRWTFLFLNIADDVRWHPLMSGLRRSSSFSI